MELLEIEDCGREYTHQVGNAGQLLYLIHCTHLTHHI
jgi:hypothetical protein